MFFWKKFPQFDALLYPLAYTFHFLTFLHITFIYIFIITHIKFNNDKLSFFFTFQKFKDCPKSKRVSHIFNFLQHSLIYTPLHLNMYTRVEWFAFFEKFKNPVVLKVAYNYHNQLLFYNLKFLNLPLAHRPRRLKIFTVESNF
jgi:hypothetical protein